MPRAAADDDESSRRQFAAQAFRHLGAVKSRVPGAYNAEARMILDFWVASNVEQDRRVVDLKQSLRALGFGPIDEPAAIDVAGGFQFFFRVLEGFFLEDDLRDWRGQAAAFQVSERGAKNRVG